MPTIRVMNPDHQELSNFEQQEAYRRERESGARIDKYRAAREAARTVEERIQVDIDERQADLDAHLSDRGRLVAYRDDIQARIDVDLEPLQAECLRRTQDHDHSERANSLRGRRNQLAQQRADAERPLVAFDKQRGNHADLCRQRIAELKVQLDAERARLAWQVTTNADLQKACEAARAKVRFVRSAVAEERDTLALYQKRLTAAHEAIEEADLLVEQLDVETADRDQLVGQGFITGKPVDAKRLADVDARVASAKAQATAATVQADAARAAVPMIEKAINDHEAAIEGATAKLAAAEEVLSRAITDLERRLTDDADREHQEKLTAAKARAASFREAETESL